MLNANSAYRPLAQLAANEAAAVSPPPDGYSAGDAVRFLKGNKSPLLALADRAPRWLGEDATFQRELAHERDWYETQRREYALVRHAWLEQGITCLMFKSAGNYPSFPHTSDNIDVLVRPEHGRDARDALRRMGYVELRNVEEPRKYLFRKFHDGRCVSAIHVHEEVAWFVGFLDEDALWARMRPASDDPLVTVPSPEDAILVNLAHACYENKLLRLNDIVRVRHALRLAGDELDWDYILRVAAARGWEDGLCFLLLVYAAVEQAVFGDSRVPAALHTELERRLLQFSYAWRRLEQVRGDVASGQVALPLSLSYWFCKRLYYRKILGDPARTFLQRWRDAALTLAWGIRLKSRIRPQPGAIISLSGFDGTGKTAHADALVEVLRVCEIKASYFWSRGGSTGLPSAISRLVHSLPWRRRATPPLADSVTRRRAKLNNPLVRFAWSWLVAIDQIGTYTLRVRLPALLGRVVVSDRYVYDTAVEMDASLPKEARWSRLAIRTLLKLAPAPDLGYVLDLSPETAQERKTDEVWHAEIDAERRRYQALAGQHGLRVLSTEGGFAESNDLLLREVIMTYMAGYETWLNALFFYNPSQKNAPDPVWSRDKGDRLADRTLRPAANAATNLEAAG
jgi:thymidylate kinase